MWWHFLHSPAFLSGRGGPAQSFRAFEHQRLQEVDENFEVGPLVRVFGREDVFRGGNGKALDDERGEISTDSAREVGDRGKSPWSRCADPDFYGCNFPSDPAGAG